MFGRCQHFGIYNFMSGRTTGICRTGRLEIFGFPSKNLKIEDEVGFFTYYVRNIQHSVNILCKLVRSNLNKLSSARFKVKTSLCVFKPRQPSMLRNVNRRNFLLAWLNFFVTRRELRWAVSYTMKHVCLFFLSLRCVNFVPLWCGNTYPQDALTGEFCLQLPKLELKTLFCSYFEMNRIILFAEAPTMLSVCWLEALSKLIVGQNSFLVWWMFSQCPKSSTSALHCTCCLELRSSLWMSCDLASVMSKSCCALDWLTRTSLWRLLHWKPRSWSCALSTRTNDFSF